MWKYIGMTTSSQPLYTVKTLSLAFSPTSSRFCRMSTKGDLWLPYYTELTWLIPRIPHSTTKSRIWKRFSREMDTPSVSSTSVYSGSSTKCTLRKKRFIQFPRRIYPSFSHFLDPSQGRWGMNSSKASKSSLQLSTSKSSSNHLQKCLLSSHSKTVSQNLFCRALYTSSSARGAIFATSGPQNDILRNVLKNICTSLHSQENRWVVCKCSHQCSTYVRNVVMNLHIWRERTSK